MLFLFDMDILQYNAFTRDPAGFLNGQNARVRLMSLTNANDNSTARVVVRTENNVETYSLAHHPPRAPLVVNLQLMNDPATGVAILHAIGNRNAIDNRHLYQSVNAYYLGWESDQAFAITLNNSPNDTLIPYFFTGPFTTCGLLAYPEGNDRLIIVHDNYNPEILEENRQEIPMLRVRHLQGIARRLVGDNFFDEGAVRLNDFEYGSSAVVFGIKKQTGWSLFLNYQVVNNKVPLGYTTTHVYPRISNE